MSTSRQLRLAPPSALGALAFVSAGLACSGTPVATDRADDPAASSPAAAGAPRPAAGQLAPTAEVEPNNKPEEATALPLGSAGVGTIAAPLPAGPKAKEPTADRDWWRFELGEAQDVRIELAGLERVDLGLWLYSSRDTKEPLIKATFNVDGDKEGQQLARLGETIPSVVLQPGAYLIRVGHAKKAAREADQFDETATYRLVVSATPVNADLEAEPNDRRVDASPLTTANPKQGYLGAKKDEDWYKLELPQLPGPKSLRLELTPPPAGKPTVSIRNEIDVVLKAVSAQQPGQKVILPGFPIDDPSVALYVVVETHWEPDPSQPYSLSATLADLDGEFEREPNERPIEATALGEEARVRGFLDQGLRLMQEPWRQADEDWYKFSFGEVKQLTVALSGLPEADVILAVYDLEGQQPVLVVDDNGKKEGEVIPRLVLKEGLIRVSAKRGDFNAELPYELVLKTMPDDQHTEVEPNDERPNGPPVFVDDEVGMRGWLHPAKDRDHFACELKGASGTYLFEVSGLPLVRLALSVLDKDGKEVASQVKAGDKEPIKLQAQLPAGVYTLRLTNNKGKPNPKDFYTLKVTEK